MRSTRSRTRGTKNQNAAISKAMHNIDKSDAASIIIPFDLENADETELEEEKFKRHNALTETETAARASLINDIITEDNNIDLPPEVKNTLDITIPEHDLAQAYEIMLEPVINNSVFGENTEIFVNAYLCNNDFFTAPASTRFHLCTETGLSLHSLSVAQRCRKLVANDNETKQQLGDNWEAIAIISGLAHDACKIDYYRTLDKPNRNGNWFSVERSRARDYEHGERSIQIVYHYYSDLLPRCAYEAIDWHMGEWDHRVNPPAYEIPDKKKYPDWYADFQKKVKNNIAIRAKIMEENPFARILHKADSESTNAGL